MTAPWRQGGWGRDRAAELAWQALSWPYIVSLAVTALFIACVVSPRLQPMAALVATQMAVMWGVTFVNRGSKKLVDAKAEQMRNGGRRET